METVREITVDARVTVGADGVFEAETAVRENDVFFAELTPSGISQARQ